MTYSFSLKYRIYADRRGRLSLLVVLSSYAKSTIPDPYYGGAEDFELALDLIEDGCEGLI